MSMPIIKDPNGGSYTPIAGTTPPVVGSPVTVYGPNGPVPGHIASGGVAVPNK